MDIWPPLGFLGWFTRNEGQTWMRDGVWFRALVGGSLVFCLIAPTLVLLCAVYSPNKNRILRRVYLVEIALFFVLLIALLPGVQ
jgi:uncharacterized membrane protein